MDTSLPYRFSCTVDPAATQVISYATSTLCCNNPDVPPPQLVFTIDKCSRQRNIPIEFVIEVTHEAGITIITSCTLHPAPCTSGNKHKMMMKTAD